MDLYDSRLAFLMHEGTIAASGHLQHTGKNVPGIQHPGTRRRLVLLAPWRHSASDDQDDTYSFHFNGLLVTCFFHVSYFYKAAFVAPTVSHISQDTGDLVIS